MKYYVKAINTNTGKAAIMTAPVFTSRRKAEEFAMEFMRLQSNSCLEVIQEKK